jgi:type IV pilus assembly protein PilW
MYPAGKSANAQHGYSLVELMVALAVAMFLIGGALTVVQHTSSTFKAQNQLAQLQDSERMAMSLITDVVQSAGYYPNPHLFTDVGTLAGTPSFVTDGSPNIAAGVVTGAKGDTITVRYAASSGDNVYNCRGDQYTGPNAYETWENTFSVVAVPGIPAGAPAQYQLQCTLWSKSAGLAPPTPLVTGVQNLSISYGLNTSATGGSCANQYRAAKDMATADWAAICSVKVTLTFANPLNPPGGTKPTIDFTRVIAVMGSAGVTS